MGLKNLLSNLFSDNNSNRFTPADWENFRNQQRPGKEVIVTNIDSYSETMVFFLSNNELPIILPCSDGIPILIESLPLEGDKLIIEKQGLQLPIVFNDTTKSYFISNYTDIAFDILFKLLDIQINLTHLRERYRIQCEPNFFARILKTGILVGLYSIGDMITFPFKQAESLNLTIKLSKYENQRNKDSFAISMTGQLLFSKLYLKPLKHGMKEYLIFLRIFHDKYGYINGYYKNQYQDDYFDLPPENSSIKLTGQIKIHDGSFEIGRILYGNYDIFTGKNIEQKAYPTKIQLLPNTITQKLRVVQKRSTKIISNADVVPPDVILYTIWGKDANGMLHFSKMINPSGILLDWDGATIINDGEFATKITGTTSHVTIFSSNYELDNKPGSFEAFFRKIFSKETENVLDCFILQHKVFSTKKALVPFIVFQTQKYDPSRSYLPSWRFEEKYINFFIIHYNDNFYSALYKGVVSIPLLENQRVNIKGRINEDYKMILVNSIHSNNANVTEIPKIPFLNKKFKKETIYRISGIIENIQLDLWKSDDFKEWLFKQDKWYNRNYNIGEFRKLYNLYTNEHFTLDFLLPYYVFDIRDNNNGVRKCIFRPMWFTSERGIFDKINIIPILSILEGDSVEIQAFEDTSGFFIVSSLINKSNNSFGVSVVDLPEDQITSLENELNLTYDDVLYFSLEGQVLTDMRILFFGFNPENFNFIKIISYLENVEDVNAYTNDIPQQVIFLMRSDDGRFISCMTKFGVLRGILNFYNDQQVIPMQTNLRISASGQFAYNGVFKIDSIKLSNN